MHGDSSSNSTLPPLDYLQPSPVRGQLEPHDEHTRKSGCRFIQCTDTPNELKVLLPPRTAQAYALLLKAELVELEKQRDASWELILDIRRLKDRMIRKCQRLAKVYFASNPGTHQSFLTLHAPPDFRVKEMEKWIRLHEGSDALKKMMPPDMLRQRGSFCCDRCANLVPHNHTISGRRSSAQSTHLRHSSTSVKSHSKAPTLPRRSSTSTSDIRVTRLPSPHRSAAVSESSIQRVTSQEARVAEHASLHTSSHVQEDVSSLISVQDRVQAHASKRRQSISVNENRFTSEALQDTRYRQGASIEENRLASEAHLQDTKYRQSISIDESRFTSVAQLQDTKRLIPTIVEDPHESSTIRSNHSSIEAHSETESLRCLSIISPDPLPVPYHGSTSATFMEICDSPYSSPLSEDEPTTDGISRLDVPRRRSSLKRSNSELRMSMAHSTKTVSWAMDRDWAHQMTKYHAAAAQADHADEEWGVVCEQYQEELAGLKVLRRNVTQTLSKLRLETEKLQREDEVIRDQENKLRQGYELLEQKHGQYRAKVKAVLQETEQVLSLCSTKRDGELQGR
ncbi:hypothetical protein JVU11DRAFT_5118 [Chiua virens]|nr:hypothetical protein JVU11DRAFT_5118 [Chiua virens]